MTRGPAPEGPIKLSVFARWYGVDHRTVMDRIKAGALTAASVGLVSGRTMILDAVKAAEEWEANVRPYSAGPNGRGGVEPSKMAAATLRERNARAALAELEHETKRRVVAPIADLERLLGEIAVQVRTGVLGLPTRARQRLPHLTASDVTVLDALAREILEEFEARAKLRRAS